MTMDIQHATEVLYALLTHPFFVLWLGVLSHLLKEFIRIKKEESSYIGFKTYFLSYPYQTALTVIGALVGFVILIETNQLSVINAFTIGYIADSIPDVIGKRSMPTEVGIDNPKAEKKDS